MERRPEDLVKGLRNLASVESIHRRLREVMEHPLSSASDIGAVLRDDPGLTARLLRLVNSPVYGFPRKIEAVSQAVSIVGMTQLHDLAVGASFISLFKDVDRDLVDMTSFWRHSIAVGVGARLIAAERREPNVERFFVAGLLHDVGRPIFYTKLPRESSTALRRARRTGEPLHEVEREVIGFDHCKLGAVLLESWKLPGMLVETVRWHHATRMASRFPVETAVVHVADFLANALRLGSSGAVAVPAFEAEAWRKLDLAETMIPSLLRQVEHQTSAAVAAMLAAA